MSYAYFRRSRKTIGTHYVPEVKKETLTRIEPEKPCVHFWSQPDSSGRVECLYCRALKEREAA